MNTEINLSEEQIQTLADQYNRFARLNMGKEANEIRNFIVNHCTLESFNRFIEVRYTNPVFTKATN